MLNCIHYIHLSQSQLIELSWVKNHSVNPKYISHVVACAEYAVLASNVWYFII